MNSPLLSYSKYLQNAKITPANQVTVAHTEDGKVFDAIFGGNENSGTASFVSFKRQTTSENEDVRAYQGKTAAIGAFQVSNKNPLVIVDNIITGVLLKTADITKPDAFKAAFAAATNADVSYKMSGTMVSQYSFNKKSCLKVASSLGDLVITPLGVDGNISLNITTFLQDSAPGCNLNFSILIYNQAEDQLILGQALFFNYNVTFDHDQDLLGLVQQPYAPVVIENHLVSIVVFCVILALSIGLAILAIYCSICRKPKAQKGGANGGGAAGEHNDEEGGAGRDSVASDKHLSVAAAEVRRSTLRRNPGADLLQPLQE